MWLLWRINMELTPKKQHSLWNMLESESCSVVADSSQPQQYMEFSWTE